jgi:hypothetical protein
MTLSSHIFKIYVMTHKYRKKLSLKIGKLYRGLLQNLEFRNVTSVAAAIQWTTNVVLTLSTTTTKNGPRLESTNGTGVPTI